MERISGIYLIFNRISKKVYLGSSVDVNRRFADHKKMLRRNRHDNQHLQNSWNKHGEIAFKFSLLERIDIVHLLEREQFWIDKLKNQFNILKKAGNTLGFTHSEEAKRKMSIAASKRTGEKNYWFGKQLPSHVSQKSAVICSQKFKGEGNPFFGKTHSQETKRKLSRAGLGRKQSASFIEKQKGNSRGAKHYTVTLPSNTTISIYNLKKFCKETGLNVTCVHRSIQLNRPYKGYQFKSS